MQNQEQTQQSGNYGTAVGSNSAMFYNKGESPTARTFQKLVIVLLTALGIASVVITVVYFVQGKGGDFKIDILLVGLSVPLCYLLLGLTVFLYRRGELLPDKLYQIWAFAVLFAIQSVLVDIIMSVLVSMSK